MSDANLSANDSCFATDNLVVKTQWLEQFLITITITKLKFLLGPELIPVSRQSARRWLFKLQTDIKLSFWRQNSDLMDSESGGLTPLQKVGCRPPVPLCELFNKDSKNSHSPKTQPRGTTTPVCPWDNLWCHGNNYQLPLDVLNLTKFCITCVLRLMVIVCTATVLRTSLYHSTSISIYTHVTFHFTARTHVIYYMRNKT